MADKDPIQDAATAEIKEWQSALGPVQFRPGLEQAKIAIELTRIRHEMSAIRLELAHMLKSGLQKR